jgi:hypothetical protein
MYKVRFVHESENEKVRVVAKAKEVDAYGSIGLTFNFETTDSIRMPVEVNLTMDLVEELTSIADELLYDEKYCKELKF